MKQLRLAKRAQGGDNAIVATAKKALELEKHIQRQEEEYDGVESQASSNQTKRVKTGRNILHLGLGAPHIPCNPIVDLALAKWAEKKQKLRAQLTALSNDPNTPRMKEASEILAKLVQLDTYQPSQGLHKARQAAADLVNMYYPFVNASAKHCCITNGSSQALSIIFQVFVEPGITVAVLAPYFPAYQRAIEAFGGRTLEIPPGTDYRFDEEVFERYLSENQVSLLVINDPCNPMGVKFNKAEISKLSRILRKPQFKNIILVLDEVYHDLVFDDERVYILQELGEDFVGRTCMVFSTSKSLAGAPGLRFGIAYSPDIMMGNQKIEVGIKLGNLMLDATCAVSTAVQYVGAKVLDAKVGKGDPKWIDISREWEKNMYEVIKSNVKLGVSLFNKESGLPLIVEPQGAFFGMILAQGIIGKTVPEEVTQLDGTLISGLPTQINSKVFSSDVDIANYFLYAAGVVTIPGSGFALPSLLGILRLSFAVDEQICKEAAARLIHARNFIV